MADLITLPGSIPGLLRRGSPVIGSGEFAGRRGVIVDPPLGGSHVVVAFEATATADASGEWLPRAELDLDLTDATGRAHATWWWANHNTGHFSRTCGLDMRARFGSLARPNVKYLDAGDSLSAVERSVGRPHRLRWGYVVPSLADLNPDDPRLLPDGSRRVDAEALRLVCLHVAGVPA